MRSGTKVDCRYPEISTTRQMSFSRVPLGRNAMQCHLTRLAPPVEFV